MWNYEFYQELLGKVGLLMVVLNCIFYPLLKYLAGFQESILLRALTVLLSAGMFLIPRKGPLSLWHKLSIEFIYFWSLPVTFYTLLLMNNENTYWFSSMAFCGFAYGLLAFQIIGISIYAIISVGLLFLVYYSPVLLQPMDPIKVLLAHVLCITTFMISATIRGMLQVGYKKQLQLNTKIADEIAEKAVLQKKYDQLETAYTGLKGAEKLVSLGTLSAGIGRELDNAVNYISVTLVPIETYLQKLDDFPDKEDLMGLFAILKRGVGLCVKVIENLKSYATQDTTGFTIYDLLRAFEELLETLKSRLEGRITVQLNVPKGLIIYGNLAGIKAIFVNLISNAIDAIEGTGTITITASQDEKHWRVTIEDTGSGMSPEVLEKILEPFCITESVKYGTVLGLLVVHQEVERHGGRFTAESEVGRGTRFSLTFPVVKLI